MNLVPVHKYALALTGPPQFLAPVANRDLWVVERGEKGRTIDPEDVAATETLVTVYEDPEGLVEATQPLQSELDGSYPYWHAPDSVDYFAADDPVSPITPTERPPGWAFKDGGFRAAVRSDHPIFNPGDFIYGGVEPGPKASGPGSTRLAGRVAGMFADLGSMRAVVQAMVRIVEANDPAEVQFGRAPGQNIFDPTWGEAIFRKRPVGHSTTVAVDAAPDADQLWLTRTKGLPSYYDGTAAGNPTFPINGAPITYTSKSQASAWLSGDAAVGATELPIAETDGAGGFPSAGRTRTRAINVAYTGKEQILDGAVDGVHKAGASSIVVRNVTQAEWDAIPQVTGAIKVTRVTGTRRFKYTAASYDSGTEKVTFTLDARTTLDRNCVDGAAVVMHKLTGVTSDFQTAVLGDHEAGETTLRLNLVHPYSGQVCPTELVEMIPTSGTLRVETLDPNPAGPGDKDLPVESLAYTDFDYTPGAETATVTLAEPLPADAPGAPDWPAGHAFASWVWIEGCPGMLRARTSGMGLTMERLSGVVGLANGASVGDVAEFSPRYGQPMETLATSGFVSHGHWKGNAGWSTQRDLIAFTGAQTGVGAKDPGGAINMTVVAPTSGFRFQKIATLARGLGILGAGVRGAGDISHPLHVGDVYTRVKPPNITFECDPEDPDCNPDNPPEPGSGQIASAAINVATVIGFPAASRIKVFTANRETGTSEERIFAYTGTREEDPNPQITGCTYDQSTQGPKTTLNGDHDLAVVTSLAVASTQAGSAPFGFAVPHPGHAGKIRAVDAPGGTVLATFTYTSKIDTAFNGLVVTSGSGTLPSGTLIEEDYALGDLWLDSGVEISLADDVRHAAVGVGTNVKTGTDRPADKQTEAGVIGPAGQAGYEMGGDVNLYRAGPDTLATDDAFEAPTVDADTVNATDVDADTVAAGDAVVGGEGPAGEAGMDLGGDTNLYRKAADTLATDDAFEAPSITATELIADGGVSVGNSQPASVLGEVTAKTEVFDAAGNSLGYVPIFDEITNIITGVPIEQTVVRIAEFEGLRWLEPLSATDVHLLEPGALDRADGVDGSDPTAVAAFLAGETEIDVFEDRELTIPIAQPLTTDVEGRIVGFTAVRQYDTYVPADPVHPIQVWDAASGRGAKA